VRFCLPALKSCIFQYFSCVCDRPITNAKLFFGGIRHQIAETDSGAKNWLTVSHRNLYSQGLKLRSVSVDVTINYNWRGNRYDRVKSSWLSIQQQLTVNTMDGNWMATGRLWSKRFPGDWSADRNQRLAGYATGSVKFHQIPNNKLCRWEMYISYIFRNAGLLAGRCHCCMSLLQCLRCNERIMS